MRAAERGVHTQIEPLLVATTVGEWREFCQLSLTILLGLICDYDKFPFAC